MRTMTRFAFVLAALSFVLTPAPPAFAQGEDEEERPGAPEPGAAEPTDPELKAAKDLLVKYLDLVKAKKWDAAKKLTHPMTVALIENLKKRTKAEEHGMAPWYWAKKDFYVKEYKIVSVRKGPGPTAVVATKEDTYRVEEKGISEADEAVYVLGKLKGKWWVVDKKSTSTELPDESVAAGYKGYFDEEPAAKKKEDEP
jgi:hypothetical protein